jgi:protocatechuate 3,4-dioxygenase beta subunit
MERARKHPIDENARAPLTRRSFVCSTAVGAGALLGASWLDLGCGAEPATAQTDGGTDATPACAETEDNILGPFYKADAPLKDTLVEPGMAGTRLTISGRVLGATCGPLAGAVLDIWQADDAGAYDLVGYTLRGKVQTAADGTFQIQTIVPGHYLNGPTYRPAHIHVKVDAAGFAPLTTQLYFPNDPYNASDPYIRPSLIMAVSDAAGGARLGRFDFVLAAAA